MRRLLATAVMLCACLSALAAPPAADNLMRSAWGGYTFARPEGWGCEQVSKSSARTLCSRYGWHTHLIEVTRVYREDADEVVGLDIRKPVTPTQLAEGFIALRQKQDPGLTLVESREATLGQLPAFRVEFAHRHANGLDLRTIVYGAVTSDGLYLYTFRTPVLQLLAIDLPLVEASVATFKARKPMRP